MSSTAVLDNEYAIGILGDALAPELPDGCMAIFDPSQSPKGGDIAAVWLRGADSPCVVRLALAVPPKGTWVDLEPMLGIKDDEGATRMISMSKVRHVHRFARIARPEELACAD